MLARPADQDRDPRLRQCREPRAPPHCCGRQCFRSHPMYRAQGCQHIRPLQAVMAGRDDKIKIRNRDARVLDLDRDCRAPCCALHGKRRAHAGPTRRDQQTRPRWVHVWRGCRPRSRQRTGRCPKGRGQPIGRRPPLQLMDDIRQPEGVGQPKALVFGPSLAVRQDPAHRRVVSHM